jgi:transcriptional regulator with XRE-family HTH domain
MTASPPPDLPFGGLLLWLRRQAGLTGQQLADRVGAGMSQAKISRLETGAATVDPRDVSRLARALGLGPAASDMLAGRADADRVARGEGRTTEWRPTRFAAADRQHEVEQVENGAREVRVFQNAVVVGLLQTSEYTRALLTAVQAALAGAKIADSAADIADAVSGRMRRQSALAEPGRRFHFVMSETVLGNRVCRPTEMLAQLDRIQEVAAQRNVTVGIIPADARLRIPAFHGFELIDDKRVMVDLVKTTLQAHDRAEVRLYRRYFDVLAEQATTDIAPILGRYFDAYFDQSRRERSRDGDHGRGGPYGQ